jgi:DNA topoisomerase-1
MKVKNLVIVESPTKAKTIGKILGRGYAVVSSMGHLIDLPEKKLGVDIENNFQPEYALIAKRGKTMVQIKKAAKEADTVYVATDPDREGEAIGWQLKERALKKKKVLRVVFHEITAAAVRQAFARPRAFDADMVEAQAGRRIMDRIVGYFLSPLLWKKIARGLSAGRVQSVALRMIVERERQIQKFIPQEYWEIEAELNKVTSHRSQVTSTFIAKLEKIDGKKAEIKNQAEAEGLAADIKGQSFSVAGVEKREKRRYPDAPFITSTLQQDAFNKLRFSASKTMQVAQQLYEGIDIGEEAPVGLITYMRTDSPRAAPEAVNEVRSHIAKYFGKDYLPAAPHTYKVKKLAQEAHEAIRPTLVHRPAEGLKEFLTPEQLKLYDLIYKRFVASQMNPALYEATLVDISAGKYLFSASGSRLLFDGFLRLYNKDDGVPEGKNTIPPLEKAEPLQLANLTPSQHFTKPPARYSDSSLVKALEEYGIGRPSTYAPIIYTLILRDYIRRIKGYFNPTELGFKVCDMLVENFPRVMDVQFTALMEEELDEIEEGRLSRVKVLDDFYQPFKESVDHAQKTVKKEVIVSSETCPDCGKQMVIKWGRRGKFLSCSGFPACRFSKSITSGVKCPQPGCAGELVERRSRRGFFYGCSNFPKCTFTCRALPQDEQEKK